MVPLTNDDSRVQLRCSEVIEDLIDEASLREMRSRQMRGARQGPLAGSLRRRLRHLVLPATERPSEGARRLVLYLRRNVVGAASVKGHAT